MASAFTVRYAGRSPVLVTDVSVMEPFDPATEKPGKGASFKAIWDTGATNTVITQRVVDGLGLKPIGVARASGANGEYDTDVYMVNLWLPNNVGFQFVRVSRGGFTGGDVLIGMDVIGLGDFAVTNLRGRTTFTFRLPSCEEIDFVQGKPKPTVAADTPSRNAPCPCGSGKKYKHCCGKGSTGP